MARVMITQWNTAAIMSAVQRKALANMDDAAAVVETAMRKKASTAPAPSSPGQGPAVVSDVYRTGLSHEVGLIGSDVVGRVGSNAPQARRLELGFVGTDSLGRNYNQAPRPHMRPALMESKSAILAALTK